MADYVNPPLEVDSTDLEGDAYDYVQTYFPEWEPREPHLAVILTEAYMQQVADTQEMASDVPPTIFRYFGRLVGIVPTESIPATANATVTTSIDTGITWEAGELMFRINIAGEDYAGFENSEPVIIPPGSTSTTFQIVALNEGTEANGLTGPLEPMTIDDRISSVSLIGTTSGGSDEEDEDTFLDRLAERLRLLADHPILPEDFEIYTRTAFPGVVDRVLALDLYDPETDTYDNERMVTVVPIGPDGESVEEHHPAIAAALNAVREINFLVNVMAPTYTEVSVSATVTAYPTWKPSDVKANVEAALASYLHPARWGQPQFGEDRRWVLDGWEKVRFSELMTVINNVEGVNYIVDDEITINGNVNTSLVLDGPAPLPALGPTINITVVAPGS